MWLLVSYAITSCRSLGLGPIIVPDSRAGTGASRATKNPASTFVITAKFVSSQGRSTVHCPDNWVAVLVVALTILVLEVRHINRLPLKFLLRSNEQDVVCDW